MPTPPRHTGPRCSQCLKWQDYLPVVFMTKFSFPRKTRPSPMTRWTLRQFCTQACADDFLSARPGVPIREFS